jgi:hypothetical protein
MTRVRWNERPPGECLAVVYHHTVGQRRTVPPKRTPLRDRELLVIGHARIRQVCCMATPRGEGSTGNRWRAGEGASAEPAGDPAEACRSKCSCSRRRIHRGHQSTILPRLPSLFFRPACLSAATVSFDGPRVTLPRADRLPVRRLRAARLPRLRGAERGERHQARGRPVAPAEVLTPPACGAPLSGT